MQTLSSKFLAIGDFFNDLFYLLMFIYFWHLRWGSMLRPCSALRDHCWQCYSRGDHMGWDAFELAGSEPGSALCQASEHPTHCTIPLAPTPPPHWGLFTRIRSLQSRTPGPGSLGMWVNGGRMMRTKCLGRARACLESFTVLMKPSRWPQSLEKNNFKIQVDLFVTLQTQGRMVFFFFLALQATCCLNPSLPL